MRLAHGVRDDDPPPPPSTGHASGNESVTPTTELVPAPHSCRSKGVDRGTSTMDDAVFDIKGPVVVPSKLCCFETERPHLADETALPSVTVTAGSTLTGRAHVATTETELGRSHIAADTTELGRFHVAVGAAAETELVRSHVAADTTELQRTRFANIELFQKLTDIKITELTEDENHDSPPKPEKRTRMHHIESHRSCVVTLSDIELNGLQPHCLEQTIEISKIPGGGSQCSLHEETPTDTNASHRHAIADAAWEALKRSIDRGRPIGTAAAIDKSQGAALNYDQVFMRDFIPSTLAFLMKGEHLIVKNFLVETARLQSSENMDLFGVHHRYSTQKTESLLADLGETAIRRVAPAYSGLWCITLLRAYTKWTGDNYLAESPNCQRAMHLILRMCLSEGCDTSPALLCADGCSMIYRKMGIYGYPIEIQTPFSMAMRCVLSLLKQDSDADFVNNTTKRIQALSYHLHSYYWLDFQRLNDIYRYKTEEYSETALNKFSVIPESIPDCIFDFMPSRGGYFIGNVSPARMDFRWFCLGKFIAILSSLATGEQAEAILDLVEERWQEVTELLRKLADSKITELTDDENHDSPPKPERRTRMHHIEGHRSCVVILSDIELDGLQPRHLLQTIEINKSAGGSQCSLHEGTPTDTNASHRHATPDATLEALKRSIAYFSGQLIGTVAAIYKSQGAALNYDQVSMRKLTPSALAFHMKETARLQSSDNMVGLFELHHRYSTQKTESLLDDLGETAIGRAAPADSGLWWITLLCAYTKWAGDNSLAESPNCQRAMHHILRLCFSEGCDTSPVLLCVDGCSMIDRRMGIFGYPIEFQARFFMAIADASWEVIKRAIVYFKGHRIQTVAAVDKPQGAAFNYDTDGSSSLNTATVCLDGSNEEVLASFRRAIGRIRWYSKTKGKCVDLSRIFGPNVEVFTTAEDGTFFVKLQYTLLRSEGALQGNPLAMEVGKTAAA